MTDPTPERQPPEIEDGRGLVRVTLLAALAGAATGLVGGLFRLCLEAADRLRDGLADWGGAAGLPGVAVLVLACAAAAGAAAWLVQRFEPFASGSGIPHVEAVVEGRLPPARLALLPVKFVGGVLGIGGGLALGREGPSVQMGASLAGLVGGLFRASPADQRILIAACAGAGLATAFNAPIAGAVFVLEELVRRFETRLAVVALAASAAAITVSRMLTGDAPDFSVTLPAVSDHAWNPVFFVLGLLAGLLAIAYNRTILAALDVAARMKSLGVAGRAALVGGCVGVLAWHAPHLVGGGDALTQRALDNAGALGPLVAVFLIRFLLGAASYAAGTPGGLFAPMLVLGAQIGQAAGQVAERLLPAMGAHAPSFAVVGMAAFFTGVVRAPVTGIVIVTEMTGGVALLLPMLTACCGAMLVTTMLRDPPIYATLRQRLLGG